MSFHVLLVDDDELVRRSVARNLEFRKYGVTACASGPEALDVLAQRDVDVVLSDVWMPEMDGLRLLEIIKERRPNLPVVLFTGNAIAEYETRARALGAVELLAKPLTPERLELALRRAVGAD
ncbi:MAG: response regulator [Myxococcota bacterium]